MVGYNFVKAALKEGHKVIAAYNSTPPPQAAGCTNIKVDLFDTHAVQRLVLDHFPDVIVHCAAVSSPDVVNADPKRAELINVSLVAEIANLANHINARLIHISTDMVFDGTAAPYKNTDVPMPMNLYGQMKLLAEKTVLKTMPAQSVILRITHVSGNSLTQRRSLHEKFFASWAAGKKLTLADNDVRKPCSAERLADVISEILERPNLSGIYHFCGMDALSRLEIGERICEHFKLNPADYIERTSLPSPINLSLDMGCLATRIKTMSTSFDTILSEMQVPLPSLDWYEKTTGIRPVKRYRL